MLKDGRLAGLWRVKAKGTNAEITVEKLARIASTDLEQEARRVAELRLRDRAGHQLTGALNGGEQHFGQMPEFAFGPGSGGFGRRTRLPWKRSRHPPQIQASFGSDAPLLNLYQAFTLAQKPKQEMVRGDLGVVERVGLLRSEVEHLLGSGCDGS